MINPIVYVTHYQKNRQLVETTFKNLNLLLAEFFPTKILEGPDLKCVEFLVIPEISVSADGSRIQIYYKLLLKAGDSIENSFLTAIPTLIQRLRVVQGLPEGYPIEFIRDNFWVREGKEWAHSIIIALILVSIIKAFVIQAFKIPSGSMRPTLLEGDKLFVNKYVYRFESPKRGDIIVFKYPRDPKKDFIKRLVAVGGDEVELRDGKIYINGSKLDDPETFGKFYYYNHGPHGDPFQTIKVPQDSYYVLGDNSANSTDSRFWGFVPKKNVLGKAIFRWWPLNRVGKLK